MVTTLEIDGRPFAVEHFTEVMMPDGIFDAALYLQRITAHVRNTSAIDLTDVTIWLEGVSDPGIAPIAFTHRFARIPAGAAVRVAWLADFRNASPGKPFVSVMAQEAGKAPRRSLKRIFVSRTTFDETSKTFTIAVPEGSLKVFAMTAHGPKSDPWKPKCDGDQRDFPAGPFVPRSFRSVWTPTPPYAGTHGDLPFDDPWWKILGWIVFAVASIAAIVAAANLGGTAFVGVKGTFDETGTVDPSIDCCEPDWKTVGKETGLDKGKVTVAAAASIVAMVGLAVGLADDADPWWRGQEATPPPPGALTQGEEVDATLTWIEPPNAGVPYRVQADWQYRRLTTAGTQSHTVSEVRENIHLADGVEVDAPSPIKAFSQPLQVRARFLRPGGKAYRGIELYSFALLVSPEAEFAAVLPLTDDGIGFDAEAEDGVYSGELHLKSLFPIIRKNNFRFGGRWRVLVFAQDVNLADPAAPPHIQAQTIGGFMIASPVTITFDPTLPCPITAQASVEVII